MAPSRILPWWPHILFVILEPAALLAGADLALRTPDEYLSRQLPAAYQPAEPASPDAAAITIALQLGNIFLLLAALAVIACTCGTPFTARTYLAVVALADLGHVYAVYRGMAGGAGVGTAAFWDWRGWNDMMVGNVGVSLFLCVNRIATVAGLFGSFGGPGRRGPVKKD